VPKIIVIGHLLFFMDHSVRRS